MQGVCKCNVGFVDELVDDVVKSLALFGEITCEIFFGALTSVLELGALAIPGVGELDAADVGMRKSSYCQSMMVTRLTTYRGCRQRC